MWSIQYVQFSSESFPGCSKGCALPDFIPFKYSFSSALFGTVCQPREFLCSTSLFFFTPQVPMPYLFFRSVPTKKLGAGSLGVYNGNVISWVVYYYYLLLGAMQVGIDCHASLHISILNIFHWHSRWLLLLRPSITFFGYKPCPFWSLRLPLKKENLISEFWCSFLLVLIITHDMWWCFSITLYLHPLYPWCFFSLILYILYIMPVIFFSYFVSSYIMSVMERCFWKISTAR